MMNTADLMLVASFRVTVAVVYCKHCAWGGSRLPFPLISSGGLDWTGLDSRDPEGVGAKASTRSSLVEGQR